MLFDVLLPLAVVVLGATGARIVTVRRTAFDRMRRSAARSVANIGGPLALRGWCHDGFMARSVRSAWAFALTRVGSSSVRWRICCVLWMRPGRSATTCPGEGVPVTRGHVGDLAAGDLTGCVDTAMRHMHSECWARQLVPIRPGAALYVRYTVHMTQSAESFAAK